MYIAISISVFLGSFFTLIPLDAECKNPTYFNIGGVLSNNDSEFHFQEIISVSGNILQFFLYT